MTSRREILQEKIDNFEGDKRTLEYKELKAELDSLGLEVTSEEVTPSKEEKTETFEQQYKVSDEVYDTIIGFNGKVRGDQLGWLFDTYNEIFDDKKQKCLCAGKIKRMVAKIKVTYERERK